MTSGFHGCAGRGVTRGFGLVLIGMILLLLNLGVLQSALFRTWWPVLLIAAGAANLFVYLRRVSRGGGRPYTDFAS